MNLLKGSTVINSVLGSFLGNQVSWQLRLLEAEGIINVVNGPHIVVMNNETADFEIDRLLQSPTVLQPVNVSSTLGTITNGLSGVTAGLLSFGANNGTTGGTGTTGGSTGSTGTTGSTGSTSSNQNNSTGIEWPLVIMTVSPDITSENSILLDIDVEIDDIEGNNGVNGFWDQTSGNNTVTGTGNGTGGSLTGPDHKIPPPIIVEIQLMILLPTGISSAIRPMDPAPATAARKRL